MRHTLAPNTLPDEHRLQGRLLARDPRAMADLYDQLGPTVFGVALRITSEQAAAEDVTQTVFIDLWRHPERFHPERGSLRPWLATVAHNRAVDWLRQSQARQRRDDQASAQLHAPAETEEVIEQRLTAEHVRHELAKLVESERAPIMLAYFGGRSYREVAEILGLPEGTVKSRIRSGLHHLASALESQRDARE